MLDKCNCGPFKFNGTLVHTKECASNPEFQMSITDRIENDGMTPRDAAMKESLTAPGVDMLLINLRAEAREAAEGVGLALTPKWDKTMRHLNTLFTQAADRIEAQDKHFTEHSDAWKANNAFHAQRIEELEKANRKVTAMWHADRAQWFNRPQCVCTICEAANKE